MKLTQLRIQNCKAIEDLTIDFEDSITLIVGENGVGKTSVLKAAHRAMLFAVSSTINKLPIAANFSRNDYRLGTNEILLSPKIEYGNITLNIPIRFTERTRGFVGSSRENSQLLRDLRQNDLPTATWPLVVFYNQKRSYFQKSKQHQSNQIPLKAYAVDHSIISVFEKWFEDLSAEEGRNVIRNENLKFRDPSLEAVRKAVKAATNFSDIFFSKDAPKGATVSDNPNESPEGIYVKKGKFNFKFDQLSSGEKTMLYLVGDIARRCGLLNPEKPLTVDGVVFIDEIDLHLHPVWQRAIIALLQKTFPNIQFVISTHSPQVIGEVEANNIRVLGQTNGSVFCERLNVDTFGRDSNFILDAVMQSSHRNLGLKKLLGTLSEQISVNNINAAQKTIELISKQYGSDLTELTIPKRQISRRQNTK